MRKKKGNQVKEAQYARAQKLWSQIGDTRVPISRREFQWMGRYIPWGQGEIRFCDKQTGFAANSYQAVALPNDGTINATFTYTNSAADFWKNEVHKSPRRCAAASARNGQEGGRPPKEK